MIHTLLKETLKKVTGWIVYEEFEEMMKHLVTRCRKEDIDRVIHDHPGIIMMPNEEAFENFHLIEIEEEREFRIEFNLWYDNEESDLSLILNVVIENDQEVEIELVDIRVM